MHYPTLPVHRIHQIAIVILTKRAAVEAAHTETLHLLIAGECLHTSDVDVVAVVLNRRMLNTTTNSFNIRLDTEKHAKLDNDILFMGVGHFSSAAGMISES